MEGVWDRLAEFTLKKAGSKYKAGIYEGVISCVVNLFLFALKFAIGLYINSISLITDAFHSLSDSLSSVVLIIGFYYSLKPPDKEHPFGHARVENVSALIVAILLFVIAFEFAKESVVKIFKPEDIIFSLPCVIVVVFTLVLKEMLARFSLKLAQKTESVAIETDAFHHKTDVYATGLVILSLVLSKFGIRFVDGIIGFAISVYIGWIAYEMAVKSINPLLGEKPDSELIEKIKRIATSFEDVKGVHDIIVHNYGDKYIISLHIEVPDKLNPNRIHEISDEIEKRISISCNATCVVHQDPINTDHPFYPKVKEVLDEIIAGKYHDLKLVGTDRKFNVIFDVNIKSHEEDVSEVIEKVKKELKSRIKEIDSVIIKIEPEFVY